VLFLGSVSSAQKSQLIQALGSGAPSYWSIDPNLYSPLIRLERQGPNLVFRGNHPMLGNQEDVLSASRTKDGVPWFKLEKKGVFEKLGDELAIWDDPKTGAMVVGKPDGENMSLYPVKIGLTWVAGTWQLGELGHHFLYIVSREKPPVSDLPPALAQYRPVDPKLVLAWAKEQAAKERFTHDFWICSDYGTLSGTVEVTKVPNRPDTALLSFTAADGQVWRWAAIQGKTMSQVTFRAGGTALVLDGVFPSGPYPKSHVPDSPDFAKMKAAPGRFWPKSLLNDGALPKLGLPANEVFRYLANPETWIVAQSKALKKVELPALPTQARMQFEKFYPKKGQFKTAKEVFAWMRSKEYKFPADFDESQWQILLSESVDETEKRSRCPLLLVSKNFSLAGTDEKSFQDALADLEQPALFWSPVGGSAVVMPKSTSIPSFPIAPAGVDILKP